MSAGNLLVFDMDGVIMDVSRSYREAVRKTVSLFLAGAKNAERLPHPLFSLEDLDQLKQTGGLNNDWDLTVQTLSLLFSKVTLPDKYLPGDCRFSEAIAGCDVAPLADFLSRHTEPLGEILKGEGKVTCPLVGAWAENDVGSGNLVKQIFQEIYLGGRLFSSIYGLSPRFNPGEGLIDQEDLFISEDILKKLVQNNTLAIATGRPAVEAEYPLERFAIRKYFQAVVSLDDCLNEERRILAQQGRKVNLSKPNPYMLDLIPELLGKTFQNLCYLGDMPDDMQAARASKSGYQAWGVVYSAADPDSLSKKLREAGAQRIIADSQEFLAL